MQSSQGPHNIAGLLTCITTTQRSETVHKILGGGGGLNKYLYGEPVPRGPTTILYTIFHKKGDPFVYLLLTSGAPFTYLVSNFAFLLTAVNLLSFK